MPQSYKFGIYVNPKEAKAVRITSPYWVPPKPGWVFLTEEANATILKVRELAGEKKLVKNPDSIQWGMIPAKE